MVHNPDTNRESKGDWMMMEKCASALQVRISKEQSDEVKYNARRLEGGSRKWVFMGHNKLLMPGLLSAADSDLMQIKRMQVECRQLHAAAEWCQQSLGTSQLFHHWPSAWHLQIYSDSCGHANRPQGSLIQAHQEPLAGTTRGREELPDWGEGHRRDFIPDNPDCGLASPF